MASSLAEKPRDLVFVSYSHADAQWRERLLVIFKPYMRKGHLSVWADPYIQVGDRWQREIDDALERTAIAVFLVSPNFLASDYIDEHELPPILSAAADGAVRLVCIPIAAVDTAITEFQEVQWAGNPDRPLDAMTEAERNAALVNIVKTINELNGQLVERPESSTPASETRRVEKAVAEVRTSDRDGAKHGVPAHKPNFVPRPDDLVGLKKAVLGGSHGAVGITGAALTEEGHRIGLHGMGGIGKTELAIAFAHDPDVGRAFPDGIFWVTLGQEPEVVRLQAWLARRLTGEAHIFANLGEGREALRGLFKDKACLLVVDDVWDAGDAAAFDVAGPQSRMLVTTRDSSLLTALSAETVELEVLPEPAALEVLALWSGQPRGKLPEEALSVARECGFLPLALSLAGARVRDGTSWADVLGALERGRLEFLDHPYGSVFKSLRISVDSLSEDEAQRYRELGVYPEDTDVPVESVCRLWRHTGDLEDFESRDLVRRLERKGLLYLGAENEAEALSFHDLQQDFLRLSMPSLADANAQLINAYSAVCPDGWASGPDDGYFFQHLPYHLAEAGRRDELVALMADYPWIQAELNATDVQSVLADYDRVIDEPDLNLIQRALRLSSNALAQEPNHLSGQLCGRLRGFDGPRIQTMLERAEAGPGSTWLSPQTGSLTPPGPLLQILAGHAMRVTSVAVLADGRVVSGSTDRTIRLWDLDSGESRLLGCHAAKVTALAVLGDGRIVSASADTTLRVWSVETGESSVLEGHKEQVETIAVMADGRLVSGSWDKTLRVWDLDNDSNRVLEGHTKKVFAVAILPDGRVVSGSEDKTVRLWDLDTENSQALMGHKREVFSVAALPDGRVVSGSRDRTIRVWDLVTGANEVLQGHKGPVTALTALADGRVASGSWDNTVRLWDLERSKSQSLKGHTSWVWALAGLPNSRLLSGSADSTVRLWDLTSRESRAIDGHVREVLAVAVLPNGSVISGSRDGTIRVWDSSNGESRAIEGHSGVVNVIVVLPDGRVVPGSNDRTMRVWDFDGGQNFVLKGRWSPVETMVVLSNGRVVSGSVDGALRVWDLSTKEQGVLPGHDGPVTLLVALPDGRVVSGSRDGTMKLWNLNCGESRALPGHNEGLTALVALADGRVVSGAQDGTMRIWDLDKCENRLIQGHKKKITSLTMLADNRVVSGSRDGTVRVWNPDTEESSVFMGHRKSVTALAILSGGRVVSGSWDATVRVWDVLGITQVATFVGDAEVTCLAVGGNDIIAVGCANGAVHILELRSP